MDAEGKMKEKNSSIFMELAEKSKKVMIWEKIAKWCFLYCACSYYQNPLFTS